MAGERAHAIASVNIPDLDGLVGRGARQHVLAELAKSAHVAGVAVEHGERAEAVVQVPHADLGVVRAAGESAAAQLEQTAHRARVALDLRRALERVHAPDFDARGARRRETILGRQALQGESAARSRRLGYGAYALEVVQVPDAQLVVHRAAGEPVRCD